MRVVAFAFVALALGALTLDTASAQSRGPDYQDDRSGPPRYYTDRPARGPEQEFDQPPPRGAPDDRSRGFEPTSASRPRPWPSDYGPDNRGPRPSYRGPERAPPRSSNYQRFWDDGDGRRGPTTAKPAVAPRDNAPPQRAVQEPVQERVPERNQERPPERAAGPVSRVAVGANQMVISITEYQSLQEQARQLQRMLGTRRDFHEDRPSRGDYREEGPRRDSGPREIYR
jgi:hypothetical protein